MTFEFQIHLVIKFPPHLCTNSPSFRRVLVDSRMSQNILSRRGQEIFYMWSTQHWKTSKDILKRDCARRVCLIPYMFSKEIWAFETLPGLSISQASTGDHSYRDEELQCAVEWHFNSLTELGRRWRLAKKVSQEAMKGEHGWCSYPTSLEGRHSSSSLVLPVKKNEAAVMC